MKTIKLSIAVCLSLLSINASALQVVCNSSLISFYEATKGLNQAIEKLQATTISEPVLSKDNSFVICVSVA